jgi:hypothetical protein
MASQKRRKFTFQRKNNPHYAPSGYALPSSRVRLERTMSSRVAFRAPRSIFCSATIDDDRRGYARTGSLPLLHPAGGGEDGMHVQPGCECSPAVWSRVQRRRLTSRPARAIGGCAVVLRFVDSRRRGSAVEERARADLRARAVRRITTGRVRFNRVNTRPQRYASHPHCVFTSLPVSFGSDN